jgi:hypothetical protein
MLTIAVVVMEDGGDCGGVSSNNIASGFGDLEVACWPLEPTIAGSNPAETIGFFRAKKSSARLAACKRTLKVALTFYFQAKFTGNFSPNSSTFHC